MAASRRRRSRRTVRTASRRRQIPGWIWLSGGLLIGAAVGYFAWLVQSPGEPARTATPEQAKAQPAPPPPPPPAKPAPRQPDPPASSERSRFEFYTLLPEMEIEVSDAHIKEGLRTPNKKAESGPYILQAGSFRRMEEADNLKARIALLGIEAQIQTVVIRDKDVWYRVRVGPYTNMRELAKAQTRLRRNDIETVALKLGT
jgi:cell division protein FtsN